MILVGDCLESLRSVPDESVNCCVTSPPYWALRRYGDNAGEYGSEPTIEAYITRQVEVFREVRRVLRKDGTCWVNIGDTYSAGGRATHGTRLGVKQESHRASHEGVNDCRITDPTLKPKDRCMIPARLALALQADGWWLRDEIVWHKPNPMPSSVKDRTTPAHEMIYLLTKSSRYWYDADSIAETSVSGQPEVPVQGWASGPGSHAAIDHAVVRVPDSFKGSVPGRKFGPGQDRRSKRDRRDRSDLAEASGRMGREPGWRKNTPDAPTRNARSIWTISTHPFAEAHFATFPPEIPKRCILAGCPEGGVVLDPYLGSGTTAMVAVQLGRQYIGCELYEQYAEMARRRIASVTPGFRFEESA